MQHAMPRAAFADAALSEAERFERDYLVARVDRDLFWLEIAEAPFKNPAFYVDWISDGLDPAPYLTREYAPLDQRMRAYIALPACSSGRGPADQDQPARAPCAAIAGTRCVRIQWLCGLL